MKKLLIVVLLSITVSSQAMFKNFGASIARITPRGTQTSASTTQIIQELVSENTKLQEENVLLNLALKAVTGTPQEATKAISEMQKIEAQTAEKNN